MSKNIVIFSDGTGNTAVKGRGTNVFKMFEAVDLNSHRVDASRVPQIAFYDDGVGTESLKLLRVFSGATGYGLARNVRQLYREICRVYDPGDRIFLFGFSRGAFTVRTLVGFIATCGLVDPERLAREGRTTTREFRHLVKEAYRIYRADKPKTLLGWLDGTPSFSKEEFRERYCHMHPGADPYQVRIAFLGVWDTVDAVGLPFRISDVWNKVMYRFKFNDTEPSGCVEYACQALAIDEERDSFQPLVWDVTKLDDEWRKCIEQVWFAGAHSNVGGGYPKQGMSLVALDWMMTKAAAHGLRFVDGDRALAKEHASVDDKLYDSRAGVGVFYRWKPRNVAKLCRPKGIDEPQVHVSVLERIVRGTEDYAPGNVPADAEVVITPSGGNDELSYARARALQDVLRSAHGGMRGRSLLSTVPRQISAGYWSYWIYVSTCLLVVVCAAASEQLRVWADGSVGVVAAAMRPSVVLQAPWLLLRGVVVLAFAFLTSPITTAWAIAQRIVEVPVFTYGLAAGFALSFGLAGWVDRRMSARFSDFWHLARPSFREALKRTRAARQPPAAPGIPGLDFGSSSGLAAPDPGNGPIRGDDSDDTERRPPNRGG